MPVEFLAQQETIIKEETNFWKLKNRVGQGYILKAGGSQITIPFEGITAFSNHLKRKQNERDKIKELTDGMSRLRIGIKQRKRRWQMTAETHGFTEEDRGPQSVQ